MHFFHEKVEREIYETKIYRLFIIIYFNNQGTPLEQIQTLNTRQFILIKLLHPEKSDPGIIGKHLFLFLWILIVRNRLAPILKKTKEKMVVMALGKVELTRMRRFVHQLRYGVKGKGGWRAPEYLPPTLNYDGR